VTDYLRPRSLDEAVAARAAHPDWLVLAGATDAMVGAAHRPEPVGLLDLWGLGELRGIRRDGDAIVIGAATTWRDVTADAVVASEIGILAAAAREIGALQIQARGTIGGNIATSSPVGDSLPVLLALDASVELASVRGARRVAYRDFCTGYRVTAMAPDELIAAVRVPVPARGTRLFWRKVGTRRAQSISKVMAAAALRVDDSVITEARIGLGAVADRPIRAVAAEVAIVGQFAGENAADAAVLALAAQLRPISDIRSTAEYRLTVAQNLVRRFVLSLA
jgi:xanthine dehydrogenase small subunit